MPSPIMKYFEYAHLSEKLQAVSKPICDVAKQMDDSLPDSAEKSVGLRKLLEAKDACVRAALTVLLLALIAAPAGAQVYPSPQSEAPAVREVAPVYHADPYGFLGWLNAYRAGAGLRAVAYDPGLAQDAAINSSRGYGHNYMGRARRQNAGIGSGPTVWARWTTSPAHNSALLDPTISAIGIAVSGAIWTFNAY